MNPTQYSLISSGDKTEAEAFNDIMQCCLPGGAFACPQGYFSQMSNCQSYMAKRCANDWDEYCEVYLANQTPQFGKTFLNDTARNKYCRKPTGAEAVDNHCSRVCQPVDPNNPDSPVICNLWGEQTYYTDPDELRSSIRDKQCSNPDPAYITSCQNAEVCDVIHPGDLTQNDPVYQRCLTWGACKDTFGKIMYGIAKAEERNDLLQSQNNGKGRYSAGAPPSDGGSSTVSEMKCDKPCMAKLLLAILAVVLVIALVFYSMRSGGGTQ